ncbi:hypothetical protein BDA96_10G197700 [Sorghum bicolor]|uniref:Uncharacterized protein n=1 Tax=Sorghum bicolor TaxID=4558 RepID=A0A921Q568_SORBI|nr:hypothetical protein BDA96_10G197700 [Sorghum bicolor]
MDSPEQTSRHPFRAHLRTAPLVRAGCRDARARASTLAAAGATSTITLGIEEHGNTEGEARPCVRHGRPPPRCRAPRIATVGKERKSDATRDAQRERKSRCHLGWKNKGEKGHRSTAGAWRCPSASWERGSRGGEAERASWLHPVRRRPKRRRDQVDQVHEDPANGPQTPPCTRAPVHRAPTPPGHWAEPAKAEAQERQPTASRRPPGYPGPNAPGVSPRSTPPGR